MNVWYFFYDFIYVVFSILGFELGFYVGEYFVWDLGLEDVGVD